MSGAGGGRPGFTGRAGGAGAGSFFVRDHDGIFTGSLIAIVPSIHPQGQSPALIIPDRYGG